MSDTNPSCSRLDGALSCVRLVRSREDAYRALGAELGRLIGAAGERALVLGLAAGNTVGGLHAEWVRLHREEGLSFAGVRTFSLDEYLGLPPGHESSFRSFMERTLFEHVDLGAAHVFMPDADLIEADPAGYAAAWEAAIDSAGGLDVQYLGVGENGHIAFNEPGSERDSRSRVVELAEGTRRASVLAFGGLEHVPRRAFTAGVATILGARRLRLLAFGEHKAEAVRRTLTGEVGAETPASWLRDHSDLEVWLDEAAAGGLDLDRLSDPAPSRRGPE